MRILLVAVGAIGLYQFLRWRDERRRPRALLTDMRDRRRRRGEAGSQPRRHVTYEVTEHDGGWAYRVDDVFSETFATRQEAMNAAETAAAAHASAGEDEVIQYQDPDGRWHEEMESGEARPETSVEESPPSRH